MNICEKDINNEIKEKEEMCLGYCTKRRSFEEYSTGLKSSLFSHIVKV